MPVKGIGGKRVICLWVPLYVCVCVCVCVKSLDMCEKDSIRAR